MTYGVSHFQWSGLAGRRGRDIIDVSRICSTGIWCPFFARTDKRDRQQSNNET